MHALDRSVTIVYECGCVLAAHASIMYTLQICLTRTNLKTLLSYRKLTHTWQFSGRQFFRGEGGDFLGGNFHGAIYNTSTRNFVLQLPKSTYSKRS